MRPLVLLFAALGLASVVALAWAAAGADQPAQPIVPTASHEPALYRRAAEAARHRRVLMIHAEPGKEPRGAVYVSHETGGGWRLFPAVPPGAEWLEKTFDGLARAVAEDWVADQKLSSDAIQALERFDVKLVVVEDGKRGVPVEVPPASSHLQAHRPGVEVRYAQPIWKLLNERPTEHPTSKEIAWAKGLRLDKSLFSNLRYGLWSIEADVEVLIEGDYLFLLPAEGALVDVDGERVQPGTASLPFVVVHLPVGVSHVRVAFHDERLRSWVAIGGGAGFVLSLVGLLLLLRPDPRAELEARQAAEAAEAAPEA